MRVRTISGLLAGLTLSACLDRGEYPSLRPRAFEANGPPGAPVPASPPAPPASMQIVARTEALLARASSGQDAFARALAAVQAAVARAGGGADSDSWIDAQSAISGLDASRAETVAAVAELDALNLSGVDAAGLRFGDNDFAAITAAAARGNMLLVAQQRAIGELAARLGAP